MTQHQRLLIIDFGSQVTQLIARRLRELNVFCEIHPYNLLTDDILRGLNPQAVILSGGPDSVTRGGSPRAPRAVFDLGVPVFGICYGQQVMMEQLGGAVEGGHHAEYGRAFIGPAEGHKGDGIFAGLFDATNKDRGREEVWMSHGDRVTALAPGFEVIGTSPNAPFAMIADESRRFYGVQFHP
jgi:GMP synthase (glutamine-hydrolysing)